MIDKQFTPEQLAHGGASQEIVNQFLIEASARDLQRYLACLFQNDPKAHQAKIALDIRLAEDAAMTAEKMSHQTTMLIQHTEQLTKQTAEHIRHSEKLTRQTDRLIAESVSLTALTKQLRFWTILLGAFAVVQIIIMMFEHWKHK